MLKKLLTASLLILFANVLVFGFQGATWERFNSPEGKFNVLMPSKPEVGVSDVDSIQGKLKLYSFSCSNSIGYFLVTYGDYIVEPKDSAQIESVLDNVRDGVISSLKGALVSEKKISLYNYPGREFVAKGKAEQGTEIVFNWKLVLVGKRLYQLGVATTPADSGSTDVAKFLSSFDLNK